VVGGADPAGRAAGLAAAVDLDRQRHPQDGDEARAHQRRSDGRSGVSDRDFLHRARRISAGAAGAAGHLCDRNGRLSRLAIAEDRPGRPERRADQRVQIPESRRRRWQEGQQRRRTGHRHHPRRQGRRARHPARRRITPKARLRRAHASPHRAVPEKSPDRRNRPRRRRLAHAILDRRRQLRRREVRPGWTLAKNASRRTAR
jgi:hypothetical protein